jgi:YidC/Oxa1 family membrane protein insertase
MLPLANVIENAFSPLITLFEQIMVFIHEAMDTVFGRSSWGIAIVGLTVLIRALLVPLTYRQLKGMQEMQRLAPQINALKEKYKEDKQRQQQELMKFYQENKINPLASCLPLLLQLPVFVSLFYMLRIDLKKRICGETPGGSLVSYFNSHAQTLQAKYHVAVHGSITKVSQLPTKFVEDTSCQTVHPHSAKFLFLPDITNKATGVALIVLIVLYVGSQLASTLIATATADANQRRLMLLLPIVFVVILYRYPAGLLVYWITTNLWTIVQQWLIKRHMGPPIKPDEIPVAPANGKPKRSILPAFGGASAGAGSSAASSPAVPPSSPPRPPRKKKKRSGRRR